MSPNSAVVLGDPVIGELEEFAIYNGELVANGSVAWDGSSWHPLGENTRTYYELAPYHEDLFGGGYYGWARGGPTGLRGDTDEDGRIGLFDASAGITCLSGPSLGDAKAASSRACLCVFNTEGDADIDLRDWAVFQNAFGEPSRD